MLNAGGTLIVTDLTARTTTFDNTAGQIKVARNLSINATDLINAQGSILHAGTSDLGIQVGAALNNTDGTLTSNANQLNLSAGTLDNTRGQILTQGVLTIQTTQGPLTNDAGLIQSGGAMSINTQGQTLSNRNAGQLGIISLGTLTVNSGNLDNTSGYLAALGGIDLTTGALTNTSGVILGSNSTRLNLASLNNAGGQIQSAGTLTVNATGTLGNTGGLLRSGSTLSAQANRIDNNQTTSNNQGIEGYDITLSTPSLNNNSGAIRADHDLSFTGSGTLDNTSGLLSAGNLLSIQDAQTFSTLAITNTGGRQIAGQKLDIKAASLTGDGQLLALGDLKLALTGSFTNSNKVQAGNNLNLSTQGAFSNSGTLQAGNKLDLSAAAIDNQASGEISALGTTHLTTPGTLTNRGLIDGSDTRIDATTVNNLGSGRIYGDHLSIAATNLNNLNENGLSPTLAARTRLDLAVTGTLTNDINALIFSAGNLAIGGALDANRQAIGRGGVINNNGGTIQSLGEMSITAQQINNTNPNFSATVTAGPTVYKTTYNTSQGTITADQIAWQIDNQGWDGTPILAGNASPNFQAPTTLLLVKKDSPYANDAGYFWLHVYAGATTTVSCDIDSNCTTVPVPPTISTTYAADNPIWSRFGLTPPATALPSASQPVAPVAPTQTCDEFGNCTPPAPALVSAWAAAYAAWQIADAAWQAAAAPYIALQHQLDNLRGSINGSSRLTVYSIINESYQPLVAQVLSSTPGQILSGGNMTLDASQSLINDKSRIIAGGALNVFGQSIANIAAEVSGTESHTGTSSAWAYGGHDGKSTGHHCDCDFYFFKPAYYALDVLVTLTSPIALVQQYQAPGGGSTVPGQGSAASIGATSTPGALTGTQATGTSPLALSVPVNLTVPATSLYHLHPGPGSGYLIETDPRFANYRSWLSSDYLLTALAYAPNSVQKRLGDGFYEQQLIREQIALLTGQRFLQGYQSDEAQYLALMNQGATVAQAWQLRPGVALSASQIAQLTSDIVWLVEQTVTLPDGTTQQVLVPQVYVVPRQGDLKGDGTLLAGNTVRLAASGDFTNSGTVAGRSLADLSAHNIKNLGGQIAGDKVSLSATNDIDNIGGRITANSSLALMAGRDINVKSTTVSGSGQSTLGQTTGQFTATQLDRLAGLYVTGDKGLLTVVAGRDINLTAAEVKNTQGDSQLLAGRDLNLETLTLSQKSDIRYSAGNTAKFGNSTEIGTTIKSGGSLALVAGNDINARAAQIDAQGDLSLRAGNDINLSAGRNEQYIDQATQQSKKTSGLFGKTTNKTTVFQEERSDAVGSSLSGQNISLQSGRDLSLEAATLTARNQLALNAGRDLTVSTAESYVVRNEQQKVSTKENYGPGKQSLKTTRDEITVTPTVSQLSARDITLQSGRDLTLVAPRITADTLTAFAGNQLTIAAATATHELNESSEFKTNRFNFSEVTNPSVTGARIKDKIKLTESEGQRQAVVAEIDAKTIVLNSIGDTILVAPKIKAETLSIEAGSINGEIINPAARIQFLGVKESTTGSSSKNSHSFVHETVRDGGSSQETLLLPDIQLSGGGTSSSLTLAAPGGIVVGATSLTPTQKELQAAGSTSGSSGNAAKPPPGQIYDLKSQAQTLAQQPGLAWLGELSQRKDVDWQKIELAQQNWDYKRSGLTQEGAAVVAIVVAIVTWGAASGAGAAAAQGAGMTTTAGAAGASTTLVAGTGGAVALTTGGAIVAAGVTAGLTTLASQAAVSLINNQGDIGKTLQDLGSQENIKALVTSMLTAGLTQGVTTAFNLPNPANASFANRFVTYTTRAMISAGVQSVVYGTPLSETAKTALINSLAQSLTSSIGDWGKSDSALIAKTIAHAVVQCATASVQGKDCGSAALGAAVAEALSPMLDRMDASTKAAGYEQSLGSSIAGMGAMLAAGLTGKDALTALNSAQMVEYYNRQLHPVEIDLINTKTREFMDRMKREGYTLTEAQASKILAENAADQVDYFDQKTPNGANPYVNAQAKQFLQEIGLAAGSFTDNRGLQIKYFTIQTSSGQVLAGDFTNPTRYADLYNSKSYQDFAYTNLNRNLLGSTPSPEALRNYISRETDQNQRAMAAAMLLAGGSGAALAVKLAPRILAAGSEFVSACAANPVACMNQLSLTAADIGLGEALPAGLGIGTANVLANKLADKARPGQIEQIAARLSSYTPDEMLAINGVTAYKDGNRNSAEAVNAYLNLTAGAQAPYMPGTVVRDVLAQPGQKLYIVENLTASGPGGWAGTRIYTDLNEARRELALLPEFKNPGEIVTNGKTTLDDLIIREYSVKQPLPTRQGMVGPQEEYFINSQGQTVPTGQRYPGGGKQMELLIDTKGLDTKGATVWESYCKRRSRAVLNLDFEVV